MSELKNTLTRKPRNTEFFVDSPQMKSSNVSDYLKSEFFNDVREYASFDKVETGFANLDRVTNLIPGLYVIGAISSIGKTTFMHQICDQMAEAGSHVLYFSLEQNRLNLVSKSLSRIMARHGFSSAMTAKDIRMNFEDKRVATAVEEYLTFAERVTIFECSYKVTVADIQEAVSRYISVYGVRPVVIIDYLQILSPAESSLTMKESVDRNVQELIDLQKSFQLILFVISAINRQNYMSVIDFESFKESGGIEYAADVVWGLQYDVLHDSVFDLSGRTNEKRDLLLKAKSSFPRRIELVSIKDRDDKSNYVCHFDYYASVNIFLPAD